MTIESAEIKYLANLKSYLSETLPLKVSQPILSPVPIGFPLSCLVPEIIGAKCNIERFFGDLEKMAAIFGKLTLDSNSEGGFSYKNQIFDQSKVIDFKKLAN